MAFIIPLIALVSVCSGAELISIDICSGESVILFRDVSLDINDTVASLYVNGANMTLIAMWMNEKLKIAESYIGKVFLDPEGNVWIRYVNTRDEAKYILLHEIGGTYRNEYEVHLTVLVAPTTNCKPAIKRVDNTLIASLQGTECGKPEASVHFEHFSDTSYQNNTAAILLPEEDTITYTACMRTPALRCSRFWNPFDFCTYFNFHNHPRAELISIDICSGESVILFRNVSLDINDTVASLYVNGANMTLIAMWMNEKLKIAESYIGKVSLDPEGNVWIRYVNTRDEAKYILLHDIGGTNRNQYEVNLTVLVAPTTNCKPAIKRVDNTLIASLQGTECGTPEASVHFENYSDTSYQNNTATILLPEEDTITYTACMQTPALRCNSSPIPLNVCTSFNFDNHPKNEEESISTNVAIISSVIPISFVLFLVGEYFILRGALRRYNRNESRHNAQEVQQVSGNGDQEQHPMIPKTENIPQLDNRNESRHNAQEVQQVQGNGEHEQHSMIPKTENIQT